ncbi:MAG: insulinase family protein [Verrucomicrobiota bacterium]
MMTRLLSLLPLVLFVLPLRASDPIPLPHEDSDILPDPAVTWGLLENGLRYAILPNAEPPERASMRLYVDAGSLMEADDQQGLAHFIEHMAFNGTENFPAGEMVEYFQRLGMGFGNHTNAHVSFNETVFKLELPNTETETMEDAMTLFRDYADRMLLLPDEIEDERGVILAEKRSRDSVGYRTFVEQIGFALPDNRVPKRFPIGTEEVIKNAPRERFVEFYENWYTPNRMVVIVVGGVEVEPIETLIRSHFEDMEAREKRPTPDIGTLSARGLSSHYHHEDEAGETSVSIEALVPRINPPDNQERRKADLTRLVAANMIDRRLERLAKDEDSPISSASMSMGDFYDLGFALYSSINADCKPENWEGALALIEQEIRRAIQFGFTEAELTETKAVLNRMYEEAAEQMGTRKSRALADRLARQIGSRKIFTSPADDLPRVQSALETINAASAQAAIADLWNSSEDKILFLSGNVEVEGEAAEKILAVYEKSAAVEVTPPEETELEAFAYADLPEAGTIAEEKTIEDLEVTQLIFANNVRANLKVTDFEDKVVYVKARIGSGRLTEPKPGLSLFSSSIFNRGGLEAHSEDDLQQLFAGESVGVGFGVDDDAFTLSGQTTPDDLETQLTLMRAYLTNPGFRKEAQTEFSRALDGLYEQLERTPGGFAQNQVALFLHSGDERFGYPARDILEAITIEDAKSWLLPELASAYLEITIVGDFDSNTAIESLSKTFGSLPERDAKKPDYSKERLVKFPDKASRQFDFESEIPKGMAVVHWPTADIYDISRSRRLSLLSSILDDRLRVKIREELGDAYSPFSHNFPSDTWTDYGYIFATVTVDPDQAESVTQVISQIAEDLQSGTSIDEDELERAKKPQIVQIEEMRRTNRYWLSSVLESSQENSERLDWARSFVDDYKAITVEEVNALAKEYLTAEREVAVTILPTSPQEEESEEEEASGSE